MQAVGVAPGEAHRHPDRRRPEPVPQAPENVLRGLLGPDAAHGPQLTLLEGHDGPHAEQVAGQDAPAEVKAEAKSQVRDALAEQVAQQTQADAVAPVVASTGYDQPQQQSVMAGMAAAAASLAAGVALFARKRVLSRR